MKDPLDPGTLDMCSVWRELFPEVIAVDQHKVAAAVGGHEAVTVVTRKLKDDETVGELAGEASVHRAAGITADMLSRFGVVPGETG